VRSSSISLDIADGIARVTFDRPERGNPIDIDFAADLSRIANECDETPGVRCVLVDARGRYFGVGADLKTMSRDRAALPRFVKDATTLVHSALSRLARMDAPVVVAAHALTVGGFVAMCAAADFCLAGASARFYAGYTGIGLVCDAGGSTFLPRRVGSRKAAEFLLLNQTWDAAEAHRNGLVNKVVPDADLAAEAMALARVLAEGPTRAFGEIKNLLLSTGAESVEGQMELEARAMARIARTEDGWRGIHDVAHKRTPRFAGR
jgi:2-(1,2-epoxy-1,2-dihydrophenyl)acetyl-CoA isomerase